MSTLKLKSLEISLNTYGIHSGRYTGTIQYETPYGETKLVLDAELSDKVLGFIGPVVTAAAGVVTRELEASIKQGLKESKAAAGLLKDKTIEVEHD